MMQRTLSFAGVRVTLRAEGSRAVESASLAFRDYATDDGPIDGGTLAVTDLGDGIEVAGGRLRARCTTGTKTLEALGRTATRMLIEPASAGLVIHAGCLSSGPSRDAGCVLFPGPSGTGKTTLVAALVRSGMFPGFATDEAVFVRDGSDRAEALTRPVHLKGASVTAVLGLGALDAEHGLVVRGANELFADARALGGTADREPRPIRAVVFPTWTAGARTRLERLSGAATARRWIASLVNARNLPGHGFPHLTSLARATPGYALHYEALPEALDALRELQPSLNAPASPLGP